MKGFYDPEKETQKMKFVWKGWKLLWEKDKMLVSNIYSFSNNVFKRLLYTSLQKCGWKEVSNIFRQEVLRIWAGQCSLFG